MPAVYTDLCWVMNTASEASPEATAFAWASICTIAFSYEDGASIQCQLREVGGVCFMHARLPQLLAYVLSGEEKIHGIRTIKWGAFAAVAELVDAQR